MTVFDFDKILPRRETNAIKWTMYDADVLPMWVADADFESPPCIADAIRQRAGSHNLYGYQMDNPPLRELIVARVADRYGWQIAASDIVFLPSLVVGLNLVCKLYGGEGGDVMTFAPIYPPFLSAPKNFGQTTLQVQLKENLDGQRLYYSIDFDALEAAVTPNTRVFLLCNPHNPIGRMFTADELTQLADFAQRHDLTLVSDDIHCDLILEEGRAHIPIASLSPEIAARTVTLMAPSKTFNMPGLGLSFAIIQNEDLRKTLIAETWSGPVAHPNIMGYIAAEAVYRDGQPWLDELLPYLRDNRDALVRYVEEHLPGVNITVPEATFLAWLDMRGTYLAAEPFKTFLEVGRVALNDGNPFGLGGEGFVRLNFACPRAVLMDGLERIRMTLYP